MSWHEWFPPLEVRRMRRQRKKSGNRTPLYSLNNMHILTWVGTTCLVAKEPIRKLPGDEVLRLRVGAACLLLRRSRTAEGLRLQITVSSTGVIGQTSTANAFMTDRIPRDSGKDI